MTLEQTITQIPGHQAKAMEQAKKRWDTIAKPLDSLGLLEEAVVRIAGLTGDSGYRIDKRCVAVLCADNGVVAQGVTQTGSEITALVAENLTRGESCVCRMARMAHCDVVPVDIGICTDVDAPGLWQCKVAYGTEDIALRPAMTRQQAVQALETGIGLVARLKEQGYQLIATGEMGIGNTTTSSAVAAVLLGQPVEVVTGRGAGLSTGGLHKKIQVIRQAIERHRPDPEDPVDVLCKVGGYDIAGLAGLCLGGALYQVPILLDGMISAVAALCALRLCPASQCAMVASHVSAEPAGAMLLQALGLKPMITAGMRMGEGTGAMAALPLLDMAYDIYHAMSTFDDIHMEGYTHQE